MDNICKNLERIRDTIKKLNGNVKVMAVSKNFSYEKVKIAYGCSQYIFGENRLQEAIEKIELSINENLDIQWHLIGHLQSNKAKKAASYFNYIDSVDSIDLAKTINKYASLENKVVNVMLEINITDDPKKFGFSKENIINNISEIIKLKNINVYGLMCIAPQSSESDIRITFRNMKVIFDNLKSGVCKNLLELSMGMSDDYIIAIEEGSTIIRIGRGVFGERS